MSELLWSHVTRGEVRASPLMSELGGQVSCAGLVDAARGAAVFDVTNVADYFYAGSPQEHWEWARDFPSVAPPFDVFWMEFRCPSRINSEGRVRLAEWNGAIERIGVLAQSMRAEQLAWMGERIHSASGRLETSGLGPAENAAALGGLLVRAAEAAGDGWTILLQLVGHYRDFGAVVWPYVHVLPVRADGTCVSGPLSYGAAESVDDLRDSGTCLLPFALAISFLHCKNVRVIEEGGRFPSRQARREAERRNLPKPAKFYTLQIEPMKKVLATEGGIARNGIKKALHICRGHFSEYSAERPLFGKYAGRFWIPAHVRGSSEIGIVGKDYAVNPPKDEVS